MKAIIVGGGIAGPATALALQQVGIASAVYERRDEGGEEGSFLTLCPNGVDALAAIQMDEAIARISIPTQGQWICGADGRRIGHIPMVVDGRQALTLKRSQLGRVLTNEARRRGIPCEFGRRLVSTTENADGTVTAQFDAGPDAQGDLIIGADGLYSALRRQLDPAAPSPRYLGIVNFGGICRNRAEGVPNHWTMVFGRKAFFGYLPTGERGTVWFVNLPHAELPRSERGLDTAERWKQTLFELFVDEPGPAAALIASGELELWADNTYDLPRVPVWHRGRMVLLGDAAHAPCPTSGQGASMALEDAVVLAKCLRDVAGVPAALAAFEAVRRQRVEKIVAAGARTSNAKLPGRFGRAVRDVMMRVLFPLFVNERSLRWMYAHHVDFNARLA